MRRSSQHVDLGVDSKSRPNIIKSVFVNVSVYFCYTTTYRDAHSHYMVLLRLPIPGTNPGYGEYTIYDQREKPEYKSHIAHLSVRYKK